MAYPKDNVIGPLSVTKLPRYNTDGSVPEEGDIFYIDAQGNPQLGSAALVARSLVSLADLAAIQAQATISRTKVYFAQDTSKQYMWTGGGSTGVWEVAEVNAGLALGETSATAFRGDQGAELYANVDHLNAIGAATGATTALKLANLTSPATPIQQGVALLGASGGATKLTKMPDGATAVAYESSRTNTTAWSNNSGGIKSLVDGKVRFTWAGSNNNGGYYGSGGIIASYAPDVLFRIRASRTLSASCYNGYDSINPITLTTEWQIVKYKNPIRELNLFAGIVQAAANCLAGDWIEFDWLWIGDYSYLPGSLSEEAARIANLRGDMPGVGVYASQTITASTTTLPTATKGDTIGGKKYTFVAALTASPGVEGEVLIDASGGDDATKCKNTLENLNLAMSEASRTNNGTLYWAAAVNPLVSSARVNEVLTLTAKTKNGPENTIGVVCEAGTNHTAGGATLLGGYTDSAAKSSAEVALASQSLVTKTSAVAADYELLLDSADGFKKKKVLKSNLETATQTAGKRVLYNAAKGINADGISFPATQAPSADVNTLDDYEEGAFTPAYVSTDNTFTLSKQEGKYTKLGNRVFCSIVLSASAVTIVTGTSGVTLSGLPYPTKSSGETRVGGNIGFALNFAKPPLNYFCATNSSTMYLYTSLTAQMVANDFTALGGTTTNYMIINFSYETA